MRCCGSTRWADAMVARRPFASLEVLHDTALEEWARLGPDDWLEAFRHHPRIGEDVDALGRPAADWSRQEQSGVRSAGRDAAEALREGNRAYEARFGFTFLVCAAGKTAHEILASLNARIGNDPAVERRIAAAEQAKIARLRLDRLASP